MLYSKQIFRLSLIIISVLFSYSCVLNFDVDSSDIDIEMTFKSDGSCQDLAGYEIVLDEPYDKTFKAIINEEGTLQHWVGMPGLEIDFNLKLFKSKDGNEKQYNYKGSISKQWVAETDKKAEFTVVCDEENQKPVVMFDKAKMVAVFTIPETCRWFNGIEFYQVLSPKEETTSLQLKRIGVDTLQNDRSVFMWHDPGTELPGVLARLIDANGNNHDFIFNIDLLWGKRFDFKIGCDPKTLGVTMDLYVNGEKRDPNATLDGDETADGDSDAVADGDSTTPADGDTTTPTDGDTTTPTDGDTATPVDGDTTTPVDGDLDSDDTDQTTGCGTVYPGPNFPFLPESILNTEKSHESTKIANTTNDAFKDDTYVMMEPAEVNQEMVFDITVPETWEYRFMAIFVGGPNWGEVSLFLDDETEPLELNTGKTTINLHRAYTGDKDEERMTPSSFEKRCLSKGTHEIKVRVVSKQSTGYNAGIDLISILAVDPPVIEDGDEEEELEPEPEPEPEPESEPEPEPEPEQETEVAD